MLYLHTLLASINTFHTSTSNFTLPLLDCILHILTLTLTLSQSIRHLNWSYQNQTVLEILSKYMHLLWLTGNAPVSNNAVALCWARLLVEWVTACGKVNHIRSIRAPATQVDSAWPSLWDRLNDCQLNRGVNNYTTRRASPMSAVQTGVWLIASNRYRHCMRGPRGSQITVLYFLVELSSDYFF